MINHNHSAALDSARTKLPKDEAICDLADLREITELLGMTQSAISHQLKVLKDAKLIANRREGKTIIYFLADDHVRSIIGQGFEHLTEEGM